MASGSVPGSTEPVPTEPPEGATADDVQAPEKPDITASSSEPVMGSDGHQSTGRDEGQGKPPMQSVSADPAFSTAVPGAQQLSSSPVEHSTTPPAEPSTRHDRAEEAQISEGTSSSPPNPATEEPGDSSPSLAITLLLTTGARQPFKIDGKYLRKRGINVENYDPFGMSVYNLKELIWREWRSGMLQRKTDMAS
jgi:hypothetical protein